MHSILWSIILNELGTQAPESVQVSLNRHGMVDACFISHYVACFYNKVHKEEIMVDRIRYCRHGNFDVEVQGPCPPDAPCHKEIGELKEQLSDENTPVKYYRHGGYIFAVYGTSSIAYVGVLQEEIKRLQGIIQSLSPTYIDFSVVEGDEGESGC